ncbi:MAG: hypothetical protein ACD_51C00298G0003 [uncultured bacterium]|nr:MAG: hypothetical protein ACD_51C00298G0003 [uncultured bacterium]OGJ46965.1 MAG: hypothetical protein A2244_04460 [Candidatus Peregrinibacteria bacterium RIFOXYA2_FULL_41_18]OGJ49383.1 MAG: hypothetical protein A2344_03075 [Candidatus Peregrinibacteria bacterium RIFOXYB12_FULL_41_12]OGJ53595.1 MAG: hypothetical protein A2448_02925 [Candidatus Peregrinibacteria bacterium RIFOXYC2_FULL_41_22]
MKIKITKNIRLTLAFVMMAVFINWQIISAYTAPSASKYSTSYYSSVYDAVVAYHSTLNDLMNDKIEILITADEEDLLFDSETCDDEFNISTYCLAESMVKEYIEFKSGLEDHSLYAIDAEDSNSEILLVDMSAKAEARSRIISLEQENAIKILDMSLAAYNELQIALPMHNSYLDTLDVLKDYDSELIDLREDVAEWEADFIDVSTTDCK